MENILVIGIKSSSENDVKRFINHYPEATLYSISNEYIEMETKENPLNTTGLNINNIEQLETYKNNMLDRDIIFDMIIFDYSTSKFLTWDKQHLDIFNELLKEDGDMYIAMDSQSIIYPFKYVIDKNENLDKLSDKFEDNFIIGFYTENILTNVNIQRETMVRHNNRDVKYSDYLKKNNKIDIHSHKLFEIVNDHNLNLLKELFGFAKFKSINIPPYNPYPIPLHIEHTDYVKKYYHIRKTNFPDIKVNMDRFYEIISTNENYSYFFEHDIQNIQMKNNFEWVNYIDYISLYTNYSLIIKLKNYNVTLQIDTSYPDIPPKINSNFDHEKLNNMINKFNNVYEWDNSKYLNEYITRLYSTIYGLIDVIKPKLNQSGGKIDYKQKYFKYKKKYFNHFK